MADTDNKVDEAAEVDSPRLKHEVEEIIEREEAASHEEEQPAITSEVEPDSLVDEPGESLEELKQRLENLESRYSSSSQEGKRLAQELERYKKREQYLQNRWDTEELFQGFEDHQTSDEDKPITRRELEIMNEQQRWKSAEETFFTNPDNKDISNPIVKKAVIAALFNDDGSMVYPDKGPLESFAAAAKEVRKVLIGERQKAKEELMKTRTAMGKATLAEGDTEKRETPVEEEEEIHEDEYARMWQRHKEQTQVG